MDFFQLLVYNKKNNTKFGGVQKMKDNRQASNKKNQKQKHNTISYSRPSHKPSDIKAKIVPGKKTNQHHQLNREE